MSHHVREETATKSVRRVLSGAGLGAALMYFCDPERGRRRRSLVRNQAIHVACKSGKAADVAWRDLQHRLYGILAEVRSAFQGREVSDDILVERVRARMGRYVSHPSSIHVAASDGCVTLSGLVLEKEEDALLSAVSSLQ